MDWESMSTLDLVNLANQLSQMLDKPPIAKTFHFQPFQMRGPKPKTSHFCHLLQRTKTVGKGIALGLSTSGGPTFKRFSNQLSQSPIPNDGVLRISKGPFPILSLFFFNCEDN